MNDKELYEILHSLKCISCDGSGATQTGDDDWEQCQFCYEIRFPFFEQAKTKLQSLLKQAELRGELKAHNRYEIVPIKNIRSHMVARKKIIEAEMEEK